MDPQVKNAMLRQEVQWRKLTGISGAGDKTYADAETIKGYQTGKRVLVITLEGEKVLSTVQVFVDGPDMSLISEGDVIMPQGYTIEYPIIKVEPFYKERGILDYGILYLA